MTELPGLLGPLDDLVDSLKYYGGYTVTPANDDPETPPFADRLRYLRDGDGLHLLATIGHAHSAADCELALAQCALLLEVAGGIANLAAGTVAVTVDS